MSLFDKLYATFENARQMFLILCIGRFHSWSGIAALWLRSINLNLSACVGFIALFGIDTSGLVRR